MTELEEITEFRGWPVGEATRELATTRTELFDPDVESLSIEPLAIAIIDNQPGPYIIRKSLNSTLRPRERRAASRRGILAAAIPRPYPKYSQMLHLNGVKVV